MWPATRKSSPAVALFGTKTTADIDLEDLAAGIRTAHSQTEVAGSDGRRIGWGDQLDVKVAGARIGGERLAGYFAPNTYQPAGLRRGTATSIST